MKENCKKKLLIILVKQPLELRVRAGGRSAIQGVDLIHLTHLYLMHFNMELTVMKKRN